MAVTSKMKTTKTDALRERRQRAYWLTKFTEWLGCRLVAVSGEELVCEWDVWDAAPSRVGVPVARFLLWVAWRKHLDLPFCPDCGCRHAKPRCHAPSTAKYGAVNGRVIRSTKGLGS